jgi:hypothetical protein
MDKKIENIGQLTGKVLLFVCIATPSFRIYIVMPKKKELVPKTAFVLAIL